MLQRFLAQMAYISHYNIHGTSYRRALGNHSCRNGPLEDRSQIVLRTCSEGATFEFTRDYTTRFRNSRFRCSRKSFEFEHYSKRDGNSAIDPSDIDQRERTQMEIADELKAVRNETAARTFVQQQPTFGGRGGMPIQYVLQANNLENFENFFLHSWKR